MDSGPGGREAVPPYNMVMGGQTPTQGSILLVDDDRLAARGLERMLLHHGYAVTTSHDGQEALELVASRTFDLVILDVMMPQMSGFEVLVALRQEHSIAELPVIMATGLDTTDDVIEALRLGANDYLTKPIDFRLAAARLSTQLELKRSRDKIFALNRQLEDAQAQVSRMMSSSPQALSDVASWAESIAFEVAAAIGVGSIGLWAIDEDTVSILVKGDVKPPHLVDLAWVLKGKRRERAEDTIFPAIGYSGELVGVLIVPGHEPDWSSTAVPIITAFAKQLAGALELRCARDLNAALPAASQDESLLERDFDYVQVCPLCGRCFNRSYRRCSSCGPGAVLHSYWSIPMVIAGRYRMTSRLGTGGMATVFAAWDQRLDREVAVKVIRPEYCHEEVIVARFAREARAAAQVRDSGVVAVYDCGDLPTGSFYIVMERLYGLPLDEVVKSYGPGRPDEVARFLREAAATIDAAHEVEIVHRDIKPSNCMLVLGNDGFTSKILDFGIAKRFNTDETLTAEGILVGTPMYMSPEQASDDIVDSRTDIYSLAAVAFFALTGEHIQEKKSSTRVLVDVVNKPPPRVSDVQPGVPQQIDQAFLWALSKEPACRPERASIWVASFADALAVMPSKVKGWRRLRRQLRDIGGERKIPTPNS